MDYIYWKWTRNDGIKKTKRRNPPMENSKIDNTINTSELDNTINTPEIDNTKNKRQECCERLSNRKLVIQKSINPYLNGNNYINDLNTQNKFLIPKDSNYRQKLK
tara:strand:- start:499 stop:813 length:315 start_codon:yes stop_codon:yes gene_type:complete